MERHDFRILIKHLLVVFGLVALLTATPFLIAGHVPAGVERLVMLQQGEIQAP